MAMAEQNYTVEIQGAPNGLKEKLQLLSRLEKGLRDYPTSASLRRAALRDVEAFNEALKAAGYYAGDTRFTLKPAESGEKIVVAFSIDAGPAFKIIKYEILYQDDAEGRPKTLEDAAIKADGSATGADLRDLQLSFLNYLWESGYPSAEISTRRAIADLNTNTAHAVFIFKSGPKARFGEVRPSGLEKTDPSYVNKLITWEPGDEYERSKIIGYRDRLAETGLFSNIDIGVGAPTAEGIAPIIVELQERQRRTIGAGASFNTSEGLGGRLFFENRNVFSKGESFRIEANGSSVEQSLNFTVDKPLPELPGNIFANIEFSNETTDAFDARSLRLSGGVAKRWFDDRLITRGALALETSKVKADGEEERTYFISAPLSVLWDSEDDILNPTDGFRTSLVVTPYTGSDTFTQVKWSARSRINFGDHDRFTLAGRASLGATFDNTLEGTPLNKRFFAGGGGSVRGFGFQEAGPLDTESDPIGGLSLIESAIELRGRVSKNIQLAGFVDAGTVSSSNLPDFNEDFFIGYGGGVRYLSTIGPIRLDVAFPTNKRDSDRSFQLYIALGQSF